MSPHCGSWCRKVFWLGGRDSDGGWAHRADRLATLGELASRLVHELRNPLSGLRGAIDLLQGRSLPEELRNEFLQLAASECGRMDGLLSDVLDAAKPKKQNDLSVKPTEFLEPAIWLAAAASGPNAVSIRTDIPPEVPAVRGNKAQLEQVFLNLILNAVQAMPDGGEIVVSAENRHGDVLFRVRDQGCGVSSELMDKIFEPFFTTKDQGTGIGLSVAREIVQKHGGTLWVEPNPASGSTFSVLLPTGHGSQRQQGRPPRLETLDTLPQEGQALVI